MIVTASISILLGAALGLRFNVFVLAPAAVLALIGTAAIEVANGAPMGSLAFAMVSVTAALQIGYFAGAITRVAAIVRSTKAGVERNFDYSADQRTSGVFKMLDIQKQMEVVGSDGDHVGTVDRKEGDRVILSGDDPKAGGKPHLISADWVDFVDNKIHLNKPSQRAFSDWQVAA
jgi:hypothetical protein